MMEKHANHASLWTANTYMTNMRVLDPLSMVPKPKSFGSASKIHLPENQSRMKATVEGEFSFDEKQSNMLRRLTLTPLIHLCNQIWAQNNISW